MIGIIIGIVVIAIVAYMITSYNGLVKTREMVRNAMGNIGAQIESRWDALTNLTDATKMYSEHEAKVLGDITAKRSGVNKNSSVSEVEKDDQLFSQALGQINVAVEAYPELKASNVYQQTMAAVEKYEENVRMSRMIYNDTVTKLNTSVQTFPTNIVAGMFGFRQEDYFESSESKAEMPSWR